MAAKKGPRLVTDEHKAAMAAGRNEARAVRAYLDALEANRPKRGRKRTPDGIKKRLDAIEAQLAEADPVTRLKLVQERLDLTVELAAGSETVDLSGLEVEFAKVARSYGARNGITYAAWREVGVPPTVLKQAGISRAS